jgi:hypothetical protein
VPYATLYLAQARSDTPGFSLTVLYFADLVTFLKN